MYHNPPELKAKPPASVTNQTHRRQPTSITSAVRPCQLPPVMEWHMGWGMLQGRKSEVGSRNSAGVQRTAYSVRRTPWSFDSRAPRILDSRLPPPASRRLDIGCVFEAAVADFDLPHPVLLDFAGYCHRELVDEADVLRNLVVRDLAAAKVADFVLGRGLAGFEADPCGHGFAQLQVGDAENLYVGDLRVRVEKLFQFARIDVLATSDDHIFGAASYAIISVRPHGGQIARVQPALAVDGRSEERR